MKDYFYDLHLHSCLSPCGGDDTTPADLAGMCALAGYQIVALTDHNTVGNCAAFCKAAEHYGLLALPGMELTTAEEVHVVCLFPDLDSAHAFGEYVRAHLPAVPNRPDFFGHQYFMDEEDHILGEETALLMGATDIPVYEAAALVHSFGGTATCTYRPRCLLPAVQSGSVDAGGRLSVCRVVPQLPGRVHRSPRSQGCKVRL